MTTESALLAAVLASPGDDLPRLVYADYIEESGDGERAEFVRLQCELARLPCDDPVDVTDFLTEVFERDVDRLTAILARAEAAHELRKAHVAGCRACQLREAAFLLLSAASAPQSGTEHGRFGGESWLPGEWPLSWGSDRGTAGFSPSWSWERGFVLFVLCSAAAWLAHGDEITRLHPVAAVRLTDRPDVMIGWRHHADGTSTNERWKGVTFTLPEPPPSTFMGIPLYAAPTLPQARRLVDHLAARRIDEERACLMLAGGQLPTPSLSWAEDAIRAAFDLVRVMDGDPAASEPLGILNASDSTSTAVSYEWPARPPRRNRPDFSAAAWQPRFPRPR